MSEIDSIAIPSETTTTPGHAPGTPVKVKKEVSPELLARLAKAREAAAAKRKLVREEKEKAKEFLKAQKKAPPQPQPEITKIERVDSDDSVSDASSTSSSDTSDSDAPVVNKRGNKKKLIHKKPRDKEEFKLLLKAEVDKAREKYRARYKARYGATQEEATPVPQEPEPQGPPKVPNPESTIKRQVKNVAKHDLQLALNRELVRGAMQNLFGL